jgi:hypothetical protein
MSLRKEIKDILYPDKLSIHILYEHTPDDTIPEVNKLALKYTIEHQPFQSCQDLGQELIY